jgi:hypothetical protein
MEPSRSAVMISSQNRTVVARTVLSMSPPAAGVFLHKLFDNGMVFHDTHENE